MSNSPARMLNSAAWFVPEGEGSGVAADDTYVTGAVVDRASFGMSRSGIAVVGVAFTTASGQSGASNALTIQVLHDDNAAMSSAATLDSDSYTYTWAADGANKGFHVIPVDFDGADQYIRVRAKLTKAGTVTLSNQFLSVGLLLSGMNVVPGSTYAAAGMEVTTEPSA